MAGEHAELDGLLAVADRAIVATASDPTPASRASPPTPSVRWLDALDGHLRREEDLVIPRVVAAISADEMTAIERGFLRRIGPRRIALTVAALDQTARPRAPADAAAAVGGAAGAADLAEALPSRPGRRRDHRHRRCVMNAPATNSIEELFAGELRALIDRSVVAHVATLDRAGRPVTWPMTPYLDDRGTALEVSTGVTYPSKAERARRDPRTCLVIGGGDAPLVRVTALATVHDRDLQLNTDRFIRQATLKTGAGWNRLPRRIVSAQAWHWVRIYITLTPVCVEWWPDGRMDGPARSWWAPTTTAPASDPPPDRLLAGRLATTPRPVEAAGRVRRNATRQPDAHRRPVQTGSHGSSPPPSPASIPAACACRFPISPPPTPGRHA